MVPVPRERARGTVSADVPREKARGTASADALREKVRETVSADAPREAARETVSSGETGAASPSAASVRLEDRERAGKTGIPFPHLW